MLLACLESELMYLCLLQIIIGNILKSKITANSNIKVNIIEFLATRNLQWDTDEIVFVFEATIC